MEKRLTFYDSLQITDGMISLLKNKNMTPSDFVRLLYRDTDRPWVQNKYREEFAKRASPELKQAVEEVRQLQERLKAINKPLGEI